jgi:ABC-type multidrug transport system ATPase subunit
MESVIEQLPEVATAADATNEAAGTRVDVISVDHRAGGRRVLHDVSLSIAPGELVALAGGSGAGKTTLLEIMAGLRRPAGGTVLHDGVPTDAKDGAPVVGFVPQDDIIHRELPLRRTLRFAAELRLPAGSSEDEIGQAVAATLRDLDLAHRADVAVGALSGGQRKRASTAVELLARPRLLLLDEPTSGLDPATAAEVLSVLRRLARGGVTVVLTTHVTADIEACDRVAFLARDGHLAFAGTPTEAKGYFEVADLTRIYRRLADEGTPEAWGRRFTATRRLVEVPPVRAPEPRARRIGAVHQWALLTRRAAEVMARNRLTLAVLLGSPLLVTAMMAVLFQPGGFGTQDQGSVGPAQTVFWIAFAGFFFGLTFGLLQIVGELAVFRRERFAGVGIGAYVLSKVAVLAPLLALVSAGLLGVLRALDRLPAAGWDVYAGLFLTLLIEALAALALGLLASAAVADAAQATLALPMLCFPQVLFAGAVVPIADMSAPGRAISVLMANRWAFEALGRSLGVSQPGYEDAFTGSPAPVWALLAGFAVVLTAATTAVLGRRTTPQAR